MVDRHRHDVVVSGHLRPVLRGELVGRAEEVAAAMQVDHHRTLAAQAGRPDVQLQHVLALPSVGPLLEERLLARPVVQALRAVGSVGQGGILAVPRRGRLGRKPAVLAPRVRPIRDALEREDAVLDVATHLPVLRLGHRGARGGAAPRWSVLVRRGMSAVGAVSGSTQRGSDSRRGGEKQHFATIERAAIPRIRLRHGVSLRYCRSTVSSSAGVFTLGRMIPRPSIDRHGAERAKRGSGTGRLGGRWGCRAA